MPHLTLEYSGNVLAEAIEPVNIQGILLELNQVLKETGSIEIANCKSRAKEAEEFAIAEGDPSAGFVHLDVRILEGRSADLKDDLGTRFLEMLKTHFLPADRVLDLQITVEIRDIVRSGYFKHPAGTLGTE